MVDVRRLGAHVEHGQAPIGLANDLPDRPGKIERPAGGPDLIRHAARGLIGLQVRKVHGGLAFVLERKCQGIVHDADDGELRGARGHGLADRIGEPEDPAEVAIDHDHFRREGHVAGGEFATGDQRNLHRGEEIRADRQHSRVRNAAVRIDGSLHADDLDLGHRAAAHRQRLARQACPDDTRLAAEVRAHILEELVTRRSGDADRTGTDAEEQHVLSIETDIDAVQVGERPAEKSGGDEKHE